MTHTGNDLELIFGRRSIRKYKSTAITEDKVQKILEAGMAAPSAVGKDPWHFIVVTDPKALKKVSEALPNGQMLAEAPLGFIICGDIDQAHTNELSYMLQDCSAAIENMLVAVHGLGLGACWLGVHPREDRVNHIKAFFNLPDHIIPIACISVGYPAEQKAPRTRFDAKKVHYEKW